MSFLGALGLLSLLYIRRYAYEFFLKAHLLMAIALISILWVHIPLKHRQSTICLAIASGVWLVQECFWISRLGYRNLRSNSSRAMSLVTHSTTDGLAEAMEITLALKKPWKIRPGEYVYVTMPTVSCRHGGFAQSHPYMITWVDGSDLTLLIQRRA
jgi:predicted ferric reductase